MPNAVSPILVPDPEAMRKQLEHVFFGDLDGAHDGLIELAWNDVHTGALSAAQLFGTDEINELIDRAAVLNKTPNCNVYIGAALRKSESARAKRGADSDLFAASCVWADVDSDVVTPAIATCKQRGVPPTMTVVTGRHPHLRAQMWWRLATPCRSPELLRGLCSSIAQAIGGDPSVVNPSRVLRLGGSVAWPAKAGRVLEHTEVHVPDVASRPRQYCLGQLLRAFAPEPGPLMTTAATPAETPVAPILPPSDTTPQVSATPHQCGRLAIGSLSSENILAAIRRGEYWHDHAVRLVGHWIARGWSDAEILTAAEALTLTGYTVAQTRREVGAMIAGGRQKWSIPDPAIEISTAGAAPFVLYPGRPSRSVQTAAT